MKNSLRPIICALLVLLYTVSVPLIAQETTPAETQVRAPDSNVNAADADSDADSDANADANSDATTDSDEPRSVRRFSRRYRSGDVVQFNGDAFLAAGDRAENVVAIFGSSTSAGETRDSVVSIFGNSTVTGPVGDNVVSIFGTTTIDSEVDRDAVAIFGDVVLGPNARIGGEVVSFGGSVKRDPQAILSGGVLNFRLPWDIGNFDGLRIWFQECVLYGRPLAFESGLGWAWSIALGFLALYVLLALIFEKAVARCADTLLVQPGKSSLAAVLTMLMTPMAFLLLAITVIGIALVPFLGIALFIAGLFGKTAVLAAIGNRATRFAGISFLTHPAVGVLIGGAAILLLYTVPILGIVIYKLLGILGTGVVVYTLLLALQARQEQKSKPPAPIQPATDPQPQVESSATSNDATTISSASPRAGFWLRLAALALDALLIALVVGLTDAPGRLFLLGIAGYGVLMWKLRGTTIGGILCGIQIVRLDNREIDWSTALVRGISCFLSLAAAGLGFLWQVFDGERQTWHDKIAGTVVVRTPKGTSLV